MNRGSPVYETGALTAKPQHHGGDANITCVKMRSRWPRSLLWKLTKFILCVVGKKKTCSSSTFLRAGSVWNQCNVTEVSVLGRGNGSA